MYRFTLALPVLLLFASPVVAQQQPSKASAQNAPSYAAIPVEAAKQQNPVKSSDESLARQEMVESRLRHVPRGER